MLRKKITTKEKAFYTLYIMLLLGTQKTSQLARALCEFYEGHVCSFKNSKNPREPSPIIYKYIVNLNREVLPFLHQNGYIKWSKGEKKKRNSSSVKLTLKGIWFLQEIPEVYNLILNKKIDEIISKKSEKKDNLRVPKFEDYDKHITFFILWHIERTEKSLSGLANFYNYYLCPWCGKALEEAGLSPILDANYVIFHIARLRRLFISDLGSITPHISNSLFQVFETWFIEAPNELIEQSHNYPVLRVFLNERTMVFLENHNKTLEEIPYSIKKKIIKDLFEKLLEKKIYKSPESLQELKYHGISVNVIKLFYEVVNEQYERLSFEIKKLSHIQKNLSKIINEKRTS